jgi:hypothetical protein
MPTIKIPLDAETYSCLSDCAGRDLRPVSWQALILLRGALGLLPMPTVEQPSLCHTELSTTLAQVDLVKEASDER